MGAIPLGRLAYGAAIVVTILSFLVSPVACADGALTDGTMYLIVEGGILAVLLVVLIAMDRAEG